MNGLHTWAIHFSQVLSPTRAMRLILVQCVVENLMSSQSALLRHFRGQLLLAVGAGVAAGVAAFLAAPWLAALLSSLGGFMTAIVVQGGVLLLRLATVSYQPRT